MMNVPGEQVGIGNMNRRAVEGRDWRKASPEELSVRGSN